MVNYRYRYGTCTQPKKKIKGFFFAGPRQISFFFGQAHQAAPYSAQTLRALCLGDSRCPNLTLGTIRGPQGAQTLRSLQFGNPKASKPYALCRLEIRRRPNLTLFSLEDSRRPNITLGMVCPASTG